MISKRTEFLDENDAPRVKVDDVMEIQDKDIIGEDELIYSRPNQYSVRVISSQAKVMKIDGKLFQKRFPKVIPIIKKQTDVRNDFMKQRLDHIKFQHEYVQLKNNRPLDPNQ